MLHAKWRQVLQTHMRSVLLAVGVFTLTAGVLVAAAASETTVVTADRDLTQFWRTTYDLLVRPKGAISPIERTYGLVEANHLSGISGGISIAQYEAIQSLPDVEVAAPIAMLGYITEPVILQTFDPPRDPGAFLFSETVIMDDGAQLLQHPLLHSAYYVDKDRPQPRQTGPGTSPYPGIMVNRTGAINASVDMPFLMAAVEPTQEAALVGLGRAVMEGNYLTGNEPLNPRSGTDPFGHPITKSDAPVLINVTPYVSMTLQIELARVSLPDEVKSLEEIAVRGGISYLASLPRQTMDARQFGQKALYDSLLRNLRGIEQSPGASGYALLRDFAASIPSPIVYREVLPPFHYSGLVLEVVPPAPRDTKGQRRSSSVGSLGQAYREYAVVTTDDTEAQFRNWFWLNTKGVFDVERIPKPADINRVPLETYFPPLATLRYSEEGRPVEPLTLRPSLNPAGYIQSPPLLLTTLAAARALRGDECISAVRVRVGGIDQLTPAAQHKIEAVATEIYRRTGLTVDVMVGSSPRRILVHVPGIGYVEEGWIQKGINVSYARQIQSGHLLLIAVLFTIGGLYIFEIAWVDLVIRRRVIALQKAIGWRSRTVATQVVVHCLLVGGFASVSGALVAWRLARLLRWQEPSLGLLVGVPLVATGLSLLGSLYPAWRVMRLPPIVDIQHAGLRHARAAPNRRISMSTGPHEASLWDWVTRYAQRGSRPLGGVWSYAWRRLVRRSARTLLSGIAVALSSALLVLLFSATVERRGLLVGTLLGEYIAATVETYDYALILIGFGLAALMMMNYHLTEIWERRCAIGMLKATGWRSRDVMRLILAEGVLLGCAGGLIGTSVGLVLVLDLFGVLSSRMIWIAVLGVSIPIMVAIVAAFYPARLAAGVLPVEAMRHAQ